MRIFLAAILCLSVSFACDQPFEEVGGYKIGCPYDPVGMEHSKKDDGTDIYVKKLEDDSFFQVVGLGLIDNKIEELSFFSAYDNPDNMKRDIENILTKFTKRWGEYKTLETGGGRTAYLFDNPNSSVLDSVGILVIQDYTSNEIGVSYTSKILEQHKNDKKEQLKKENLKKLEGF
ncbi:hypothetical protein [Wohlfahrtiimonas chitiniclastica]|uniref:hypothetical protein n=1 Tax=Wohlfahrtiimonas chitiniclastica TaxID=400946 RepID=UPI000B99B6F6|nr:hypothetical protein [Wohlfahrtiimonas chitiniclastica]MBS7815929.1 hypothetical protein [Wohlfahrtiimonas chitiniclastica]MBS7822076.1 hypothetical protein [Wohlfahrtiimonas chitiniclastica]MBS7829868.1 hypothetical protein [Wohlfahrtiimonas chitiniclastica]MBS7831835.1 hypothetical protein [Wohlfahrtiimonas chitiniclastica]MBS7835146.1 hypothetical protein [Wohlfahrtiimonas chitiniclastica]